MVKVQAVSYTHLYASVSFQQTGSDISDREIVEDFLKTAEKYDVDFFMVDNRIKSSYETDIDIYGTPAALVYLADHEIAPKEYNSCLLYTSRCV